MQALFVISQFVVLVVQLPKVVHVRSLARVYVFLDGMAQIVTLLSVPLVASEYYTDLAVGKYVFAYYEGLVLVRSGWVLSKICMT